jgi:hypothetical protein
VAAIGNDVIPLDGETKVVLPNKEEPQGTPIDAEDIIKAIGPILTPDQREKQIEVLRFRLADDDRRMAILDKDIKALDGHMVKLVERLNQYQEQRGEMMKHMERFKVWRSITVRALGQLGASP